MTTTFAAVGTQELSAVFTPTDDAVFTASTGTATLTMSAPQSNSGTIPLAATVPVTGTFSLTVDTTDTVTLTVSGSNATAATTPIVVSDTRNTFPGWSVSAQAANFTGSGEASGASISAGQLRWQPTDTSLGTGAILGSGIPPVPPGLSAPPPLASAQPGNGYATSTLGANLTLALPAETAAGDYSGSPL